MNSTIAHGALARAPMLTIATLLIGLASCTAPTSSTQLGNGTDGGNAEPSTAPLSCSGIFDCASACDAGESACEDACLAKGGPAAREAANGLAACARANASCDDAACLQEACRAQLKACIDTSMPSGGKPLDGAAPPGVVPSDLVAVWKGLEETLELRADGTVGRSLRIRAATCTYEAIENGTAVVEGTTLTLYFTSGTFRDCTGPNADPYRPTTESFTFGLTTYSASTVLRLERQVCAPGAYCISSYDKH